MAGKRTMEALMLHRKGFNCAQSVVLPFCEDFGIDRVTAMKMSEGFGAGMGACQHVCGALSGAVMVAGLKNCNGNLNDHTSKKDTYAVCRDLTAAFEKECGSCNCSVIRGLETKQPLKTCDECVFIAANLLEKELNK